MLEVEMKFRVDDAEQLAAKLSRWTALPARRDVDYYFNGPDRDFAITDEAFRIRTIGDKNFITYKGPKLDKKTKTRFELELPLPDGADAAQEWREMLTRLGYRATGVVHKSRRQFVAKRGGFELSANIDDVDDVGVYTELEIVADESQQEQARDTVLKCAEELGLTQNERRGYLSMMLATRGETKSQFVVKTVSELRRAVRSARRRDESVGFVPTMGALHAGHLALIERAKSECDHVVVSIFVNPAQFGPDEDFNQYPRTLEADLKLCRELGVDVVYVPEVVTMYPEGFTSFVDVGRLGESYEGAIRPGHFRGVATVVLMLFNQVKADVAYFGQKDAQQVAIIRQMVRELDVPVQLGVSATVRESDGLALSSRNRYLEPAQRKQATILYQALLAVKKRWSAGERDFDRLADTMRQAVATMPSVRLDYAAIVDPNSFGPPVEEALAIIAARVGSTRLIDNLPLEGKVGD